MLSKPKVCVITFTYNEEDIIPYFLRHYWFADKIIVYDNLSMDNTLNLLNKDNRVFIRIRTNNKINDIDLLKIKNNAWKQFRDYDWVIIVDIDEFLYSENVVDELFNYKERMVDIFSNTGYTMIGDFFPYSSIEEYNNKQLWEICQYGLYSSQYGKTVCFNPKNIKEINYNIGGHLCQPEGFDKITLGWSNFKLLHFNRQFGYEYWLKRNSILMQREGVDGYSSIYRFFNDKIKCKEDYEKEFKYKERIKII